MDNETRREMDKCNKIIDDLIARYDQDGSVISDPAEELDINTFNLKPTKEMYIQETEIDGILSLLNYENERRLLIVTTEDCVAQVQPVVDSYDNASVISVDVEGLVPEGTFDIIVVYKALQKLNDNDVEECIGSMRRYMKGSTCIAANFRFANRSEQSNKENEDGLFMHSPALLKAACKRLRFAFMPTAIVSGDTTWCVIE